MQLKKMMFFGSIGFNSYNGKRATDGYQYQQKGSFVMLGLEYDLIWGLFGVNVIGSRANERTFFYNGRRLLRKSCWGYYMMENLIGFLFNRT